MRSRNNGKPVTRQQARLTRRLARGAVAFLDWLDSDDLTLGSCQQADLDRWLANGQAVYREEAGLIRWAHASKLTTCYLPPPPGGTGPPSSSITRTAGTSPAGSCTTTRSSPRTASPGCSSCSTPRASRRSAG